MEMRSSMLILFAFACGLAVAQEDLFQSMTVVPTPVPTSVPPNPRPGNNSEMSFYVLDAVNKSHVCLHLRAAIAVDITYINSAKENVSRAVNLTEHAPSMDRRSVCNSTSLYAKLFIALEDDEDMVPRPLYMTFEFTGRKDNWSMGNITFTLDLEYLDNYNASETSVNVTFATGDQLHDSANNEIEYTRSYKCNSDQTLYFNKTRSIAPIVHINKLRVQAFRFENKTSGAFDDARSCLLDTAGKANKIVPIAVGAALAGLVVVVLIAYLIGRLRSRRQSSYEALS